MAKPEKQQKEKINFKVLFSRFYQMITIGLAVIILVVGGYFILLPKYRQVSANSLQVSAALKKEESKRIDYLKNLKELISNHKKINQQEVGKLKTLLPANKDLPGLFVQLQGLAEENNFLLSSVNINEMPDGSGTKAEKIKIEEEGTTAASASGQKKAVSGAIKKLSVNINLVGNKVTGYEAFKSFLSALEQNLRLFDIEAIYFTPQSPKYSLTLFTYYLPQ